jgi:hypothetical protein
MTTVQGETRTFDIKHFHLFCGLGGGARGFNKGHARNGTLEAKFRCLGGIDNDAAAIRDFDKLAGVPPLFDHPRWKEQWLHGRDAME